MPTVSVIIITKNEEKNIERCLNSVHWADELIVVDSFSTDRTVELARNFTQKVYQREWEGFSRSKNFAVQQAKGEWILWLDADEVVPAELAREIRETLINATADGYEIPRLANFLGRWIRHGGWFPGYVMRLVKRQYAHFPDKAVHEYLAPPPSVKRLQNHLLHYTDPDLTHYLKKLNRYTSLAAGEMAEQGKSFHLIDMLIRPLHIFFKMYILKRGFLDGFQGFLLAMLSGFYVFIKYAKLWERTYQKRNENQNGMD